MIHLFLNGVKEDFIMPEYTAWITEQIRKVCETYKKRTAGSASVRSAMRYMAGQLQAWSDSVKETSFTFHPHAFIASMGVHVFCDICATFCFVLSVLLPSRLLAFASPLFFMTALLAAVFQYILYDRLFDPLYPKREGINILAVRKAKKTAKQRIIFCGHADAAFEMPVFLRPKMAWAVYLLTLLANIGLLMGLTTGVLNLLITISAQTLKSLAIAEVCFLPFYIPFFFFVRWNVVADGANDNLTGCYLSMSILKKMADEDIRLDHTDVCCLITDGEESGLRGAMAYAETNKDELLDTNSIIIAVDTIRETDQLAVYHRGINFTQKNDPAVCELLHRAGLACGIDLPYAKFYPGASDAEAFSRNGIPAAAICAVRHSTVSYYHTRKDSWDNLDTDCIEATQQILWNAAELLDKETETGI